MDAEQIEIPSADEARAAAFQFLRVAASAERLANLHAPGSNSHALAAGRAALCRNLAAFSFRLCATGRIDADG